MDPAYATAVNSTDRPDVLSSAFAGVRQDLDPRDFHRAPECVDAPTLDDRASVGFSPSKCHQFWRVPIAFVAHEVPATISELQKKNNNCYHSKKNEL